MGLCFGFFKQTRLRNFVVIFMNLVFQKWFRLSVLGILTFTGGAKILSAFGSARILNYADPILGFSFGHLMLGVGILELSVAGLCLFNKSSQLATILVACLATNFLLYRLGLWWLGWHRPCSCLGNLTDALNIPPQTADMAMKIILAYLLIGSYATLFWLWWQRKHLAMAARR